MEAFAIFNRMNEPKLSFLHWICYFGVALLITALPCYFFHTVKGLDVELNQPLYCAVLLGASLLLTVAYHAFAVLGARLYKDRSDVLSKNWPAAQVDQKVNSVLSMGRLFAFAVVNTAYVFAVFVCSFPRIFGRFEDSTAFALSVAFPASALAFVGSALL